MTAPPLTHPLASVRATIANAQASATASAVASYSSMERLAQKLPAHMQLSLIRAVLPNLSFSNGHGDIVTGLEAIQDDLDAETRRNDEPLCGWRAS